MDLGGPHIITKLKYVAVCIEELLEICILFIRSVTEKSDKLEKVQKTCLKVILGDSYISYSAALEMCWLRTLFARR